MPPYAWSATGIPSGLALSAGGVWSGSPNAANTYSIPITLNDSVSDTPATVTFSLTVNSAALAVPGFVQGRATSTNTQVQVASPPSASIRLPNNSLSGNCLILCVMSDYGVSTTTPRRLQITSRLNMGTPAVTSYVNPQRRLDIFVGLTVPLESTRSPSRTPPPVVQINTAATSSITSQPLLRWIPLRVEQRPAGRCIRRSTGN